jgi:DNA-binding TFAR19-related protein (PDSD5 family)
MGIVQNIFLYFQGMGGRPGGGGADQQKEMQEKQQAMEDMRNSILSQVLTQEARARCK